MEILEIQSAHSLTTSMTNSRPIGAHSYQINCRQFISTSKSRQKDSVAQGHALGVVTLGFERIWMTGDEVAQVAAAIQSNRSPLALG